MIIAMIINVMHIKVIVQVNYHHITKHSVENHYESRYIIHTMMNELQNREFQFCHSYNHYHSPYTMAIFGNS